MGVTDDMSTEVKNREKESWNQFLSQMETFLRELNKPYSFGVLWTYTYRKNFEAILRLIGDVKDRTILDIGCGGGWLCEWFALEGATTVGIDISLEFCRAAKERNRRKGLDSNFICADGENLPFKENSFYASVAYQSLHHLPNPEKAIEEGLRISEVFVLGDEPAKLLFPNFFVKLIKMLVLSKAHVGELSGIEEERFDPLVLLDRKSVKGYSVKFEKQWSMVPAVFSKMEKYIVAKWIYKCIYNFLMKIEPIQNMGHGFTMIIERQERGEFYESLSWEHH
jgi:ubiquinone/menaquinone biosynthesis C-methylase UbiE